MAIIVKGADVAAGLKKDILSRIAELSSKNRTAKLATLCVGDDPANASYERGIIKVFSELGILYEKTVLAPDCTQEEFDSTFTTLNEDPFVSGIMVFRPLPRPLSIDFAVRTIDPAKDVDCMGYVNQALTAIGSRDCYYPCTAEAVLKFLEFENIDLAYKNVVVIGRSVVVGRPLVSMLISRNATVTCCHTKTADITDRIKNADIVVSAAGSRGLLKGDMLRDAGKDCFCIDVGINMREDGKGICGDIDFESVEPLCGRITTVPGGVGSVTSTLLAEHVVRGAEKGE